MVVPISVRALLVFQTNDSFDGLLQWLDELLDLSIIRLLASSACQQKTADICELLLDKADLGI